MPNRPRTKGWIYSCQTRQEVEHRAKQVVAELVYFREAADWISKIYVWELMPEEGWHREIGDSCYGQHFRDQVAKLLVKSWATKQTTDIAKWVSKEVSDSIGEHLKRIGYKGAELEAKRLEVCGKLRVPRQASLGLEYEG